MRRLLLGVAVAALFAAPALAGWRHHHDDQAPASENVENGSHNYSIFEKDPRVSCWHVHADGPKNRQLWICDDH